MSSTPLACASSLLFSLPPQPCPTTPAQVAVPVSDVFGAGAERWLLPDTVVSVAYLAGAQAEQPVTGSIPTKLTLKVIEAQPAVPRTDGTTNR